MFKKKYRTLLFIALTCCILAAGVVSYMLYMPHRDVRHETPVITSAMELVDAYQKDESLANTLFLDKILQVTGTISEVENNNDGQIVVVLTGINPLSTVRCTLQEKQTVDAGKSITLKGRCTGYLSDVIMIDCLIIK